MSHTEKSRTAREYRGADRTTAFRPPVLPGVSLPGGARGAQAAPPATARVLLGDGSVLALAHRGLTQWALREGPQVVLDCGGVLDVYRLALEARRLGQPPRAVLERIQVCRAFTGYQEVRALLNLRRRFGPGHRITVLNPLVPLLDEDLPEGDRPWLFRRLLDGIACLAREGYPVQVCQPTVSAIFATSMASVASVTGTPAADSSLAGVSVIAKQAAAFEKTLAQRFALRIAARGRILGASDGQERHPLFPRGGPGGGILRGLSPRPDAGGSEALRQAV